MPRNDLNFHLRQPQQQSSSMLTEVWQKLIAEKRPLAIQDFTGLDPKAVGVALTQLHQEGYVYLIEGLWAPTRAAMQQSPDEALPSPVADIADISEMPTFRAICTSGTRALKFTMESTFRSFSESCSSRTSAPVKAVYDSFGCFFSASIR